MIRFLLVFFALFPLKAYCVPCERGHQFFIGPEYYYVKRRKDGGTKQDGHMAGVRLGYDRFKRFGWYWGADAAYARGTLRGNSSKSSKLRSCFKDGLVEGRFGFTFQQCGGCQLAFTPFVGVGYLWEKNEFGGPSPIHVHFKTTFPYGVVGFALWAALCDPFEIGLNTKVKFPYEPKCNASHDKEHDAFSQRIKEQVHCRVELPITYRIACEGCVALSMVPFFEHRDYGSCPNHPFDFIETKFNNWGATLQIQYRLGFE